LFGAPEMDCYGIIDFENEKTILFVPKLDNYYKIWMTVPDSEGYKRRYNLIDEIHFTDEIEALFEKLKPECVFVNLGKNSDSGLTTMVPEEEYYNKVC
jgi:Xaa-Pro dipeptidase